jgi:hypothetical protein
VTEDVEYKEIFSLRMVQNTAAENVRTEEKGRNRRTEENVT